jgi:hypothetical protein
VERAERLLRLRVRQTTERVARAELALARARNRASNELAHPERARWRSKTPGVVRRRSVRAAQRELEQATAAADEAKRALSRLADQ